MKKLFALIGARNKEFYRDRSAMIWTLLFPFIVLIGFTYGYSGKQEPILKISTSTSIDQTLIDSIKQTPGIDLQTNQDQTASLKKLARYQLDLYIDKDSYTYNPDSEKAKLASRLFEQDMAKLNRHNFSAKTIQGTKIRYSDWVLPGLLSMNIMFGSMFGVGYVIVRYRKNGVLKRLRATPLSALQFLIAQIISRMLLMVITSFIVLGGAMFLIGFKPQGTFLDTALFLMVSSIAMISVGLLIAARIANEEVAEGVLNLMTWPMIFLSGIWFSIDGANKWIIAFSKLMPLTHVVDGLRAILIDGTSISQLMPQIGLLLIISAVFVIIGSAVFRWR